MDTLKTPVKSAEEVEAVLQVIKGRMPETYKAIQTKAAEIGKPAYALVRKGIQGQANHFYAFERGHVVGTPFTLPELHRDIAEHMLTFGVDHVTIWAEQAVQPSASNAQGVGA